MLILPLWLLFALAVPGAGYLFLLTAASLLPRRRLPRRAVMPQRHYAVVVPAHNEELLLHETLESLCRQQYPRNLFSIHVVADNCSDRTADVARRFDVEVHERTDPDNPGKGQALDWLLKRIRNGAYDAVVFVDADTLVAPDFLRITSNYLDEGCKVLQANYRVRDPESSVVVGLRALAFSLFHGLRGRGKARLGMSCGLWGNGMVFDRETLESIPWESYTAVEDAEQYLRLLLAGVKVTYVESARVYGHMPSNLKVAREQQRRWEAGRLALAREFSGPLLGGALKARRPNLAMAAVEMLLPPLSVHAAFTFALLPLAIVLGSDSQIVLAGGCAAALTLYVLVGFATARLPLKTYLSLFYAPIYVGWKLSLFAIEFVRRRSPQWVRTARDSEAAST